MPVDADFLKVLGTPTGRGIYADWLREHDRWVEPELLALVLAHRDQDGPRLLYADWCEEQAKSAACILCGGKGVIDRPIICGPDLSESERRRIADEAGGPIPCPSCRRRQPGLAAAPAARAEFIRVQCELAGLPTTIPCLCNRCGRTEQRRSWSVQSRCGRCRGSLCRQDGLKTSFHTQDARCPEVHLRRRERELLQHFTGASFGLPHFILSLTLAGEPVFFGRDGKEVCRPTFRRGFVAAVTCTAEAWLGGAPCEKCEGNGGWDWYPDNDPTNSRLEGPVYHRCSDCKGSGRTPGHADALLRAAPIEEVRLTTWPFNLLLEGRGDPAELDRQWPGIKFRLPGA